MLLRCYLQCSAPTAKRARRCHIVPCSQKWPCWQPHKAYSSCQLQFLSTRVYEAPWAKRLPSVHCPSKNLHHSCAIFQQIYSQFMVPLLDYLRWVAAAESLPYPLSTSTYCLQAHCICLTVEPPCAGPITRLSPARLTPAL